MMDGSLAAIAYKDDDIVMCGGLSPAGDKWEAWISLAVNQLYSNITMGRAVHDVFAVFVASVDDGIMCHVRDGYRDGDRLARFLGFKQNDKAVERDGLNYNEYILWH